MSFIIDLIIIAIILLFTFLGHKRGLVKVAFKLCTFFIAIVVAFLLFKPVAGLVIEKTTIDENIENMKSVKIVANLPYYITTPIIMKLLEDNLNIECITVMIQKEVSDRITAIPGEKNSGAITYSVYYYADAKEVCFVSKDCFIPAPEVNSEVINLHIRGERTVKVKSEEMFFKVIKASFMQRRKTLLNGLVNSSIVKDKETGKSLLKDIGLPENIRGENLSIEQFAKLADELVK